MTEQQSNEQLDEDPQVLADIAKATQDLAEFLKLHNIEVDYCEADWKDGAELARSVHNLCLKHPSWSMYYFGGDTWGIDSNFVFFTSKEVEGEVVEKIGEYIVEFGAELPGEVVLSKPVCPKCGEEVDGLSVSWSASIPGIASLVDGELYTDTPDGLHPGELIDEDTAVYYCPECEAELFKAGQEDKVTAFLKCELAVTDSIDPVCSWSHAGPSGLAHHKSYGPLPTKAEREQGKVMYCTLCEKEVVWKVLY